MLLKVTMHYLRGSESLNGSTSSAWAKYVWQGLSLCCYKFSQSSDGLPCVLHPMPLHMRVESAISSERIYSAHATTTTGSNPTALNNSLHTLDVIRIMSAFRPHWTRHCRYRRYP
jgi:hypothetical protein